MICVTVETREGSVTRRIRITARSIEVAMQMVRDGKPGRRARLLFPIEPRAFFVPADLGRREAA